MLRFAFAITLTLGCALVSAQEHTPVPKRDLVVRCGTLLVGDGRSVDGAWLVIRGGKVAEILEASAVPPADLPVLDAHDRYVMPGMVIADTDLSGHGDEPFAVTPDLMAIDGFDFVRSHQRALSGGVTTVYLSPGRNRLIPGQGSVVKLAGDDLVQRVLSEANCLRITLGLEANTAPAVFEPTASPSAEDPLLPARTQVPSSRISQLHELRRIFADALSRPADAENQYAGSDRVENRYEVTALRQAAEGKLPLRIFARGASDIRRALQFAESLKARVLLENPTEIAPVAALAARAGAGAVFRLPVLPGQSNPGGEDLADKSLVDRPEAAAAAQRAGMKVAIAAADDSYLRDMLMVLGLAVRFGMDADAALRSVTVDAAQLLGVGDRVGSLVPGKDADFLVLSGHPIGLGTFVEQTFVDGTMLFERKASSDLMAIKVSRVETVTAGTLRDAVILVENGKIKAIGENLPIPFGARLITIEGGVAVPGFVDAYSHVGLSGQRIGIPGGAADQLIHEVVRADDPMLAEAASGGLTTVLVSGRDGGLVSGRVAAIKTAAGLSDPESRDGLVLKPIAGIRFVHDAVGPNAIRQLSGAVERGKQYIEAWARYEKALADWKAGKAEKPAEAEPKPEAVDDPVSGVWEIEVKDLPIPIPIALRATLKLEPPNKVTGTIAVTLQGRQIPPQPIRSGTFQGGKLTVVMAGGIGGGTSTVEATIQNDTLTGTFGGGQVNGTITGRRVSRDTAAPASATGSGDGSPTRPKVDESLEPLRLLWEKKIPAIVRVQRAPAITDVMEWFDGQKLPYVLADAADAVDTPSLMAKSKPALLLGPEVLREDRRTSVNVPGRMTDAGHPIAFGTGDVSGARYLSLHAAMAVRYGMDPQEALRALTLHPAKMFQLDDRIGSLERGKDADLVVFVGGGPFDLSSRIALVMVNGQVVIDQRKETVK